VSTAIITVENLSKRYRVAQERERYVALRDVLARALRSPFQAFASGARRARQEREEFWALNDVSFEVGHGEVLGIVGRNGAGKSTLLKVLSRITEPTRGSVTLDGRVASLLEVGTGFHPELTGRENIFLNGAILGMTRVEIKRKFDEIVAFAEIERFLDTPVKRYSTGMHVRLAFAVAAHLEPEVLIVDEVLAVGDAQFQKKCLGRMSTVAASGRTVLFVSHYLNAVEQLCNTAMILDHGRIVRHGTDVPAILRDYSQGGVTSDKTTEWVRSTQINGCDNEYFTPVRFGFRHGDGRPLTRSVSKTDDVCLEIECLVDQLDPALTFGYALYAEDGTLLYWSYQTDVGETSWPQLRLGHNLLRSRLPTFLNEGEYRAELIAGLHCRHWIQEPGKSVAAATITIEGGLSESPYWVWKRPGLLAPAIEWETVRSPAMSGQLDL
jgi:lipopolysaccharide transport system ATP-binding protein